MHGGGSGNGNDGENGGGHIDDDNDDDMDIMTEKSFVLLNVLTNERWELETKTLGALREAVQILLDAKLGLKKLADDDVFIQQTAKLRSGIDIHDDDFLHDVTIPSEKSQLDDQGEKELKEKKKKKETEGGGEKRKSLSSTASKKRQVEVIEIIDDEEEEEEEEEEIAHKSRRQKKK